jgi:hypothetical protein
MKRSDWLCALLLCLLLAACGGSSSALPVGSNTNAGGGATTPVPANGPTVLHVTRTDPSVTNNLGPLDRTVTDVQTVQHLYHAALALPAYAVGSSISQSCLNDLGVIYHLDFLQGTTEVQRMNLDPGTCKILYLSQTDLRQASDAFLNLFKQALQLSSLTAD